jgi:Flp pilus assembly protein CpaB
LLDLISVFPRCGSLVRTAIGVAMFVFLRAGLLIGWSVRDTRNVKNSLIGENLSTGVPPTAKKKSVSGSGLLSTPAGLRAVTVRIDTMEELPEAMPGDRADILFTQEEEEGNRSTSVLAENVFVLSVCSLRQRNGDEPDLIQQLPAVQTVAASPGDAARIIGAKEKGCLSLIPARTQP